MAGRYTKDVGVESLRKFKIGGTSSVRGLNMYYVCAELDSTCNLNCQNKESLFQSSDGQAVSPIIRQYKFAAKSFFSLTLD